MSDPRFDVIGVGNAIVDVLSPVEDAFLEKHGIAKGGMTLIEQDQAETLYGQFSGEKTEKAGGSTANTIAGLASLGLDGAFIGKTADDALGESFGSSLRDLGVHFETRPLSGGPSTARCLIAVTPDGERSMSTFLGASVEFGEDDVDEELIKKSKIVMLEGYLFDKEAAKHAFVKAAEVAQANKRNVALTLSDTFCVERHRASFKHLVKNHVDILFANEAEICSLYETDDFDSAVGKVGQDCKLAALTRSEKGALIVSGDTAHKIEARPVDKVVDVTGAGDLYAAGFLAAYARGLDLADCGKLGAIAAAEVISHYGARPETPLDRLAADAGIRL